MSLPIIALVGRPDTGKSTILNKFSDSVNQEEEDPLPSSAKKIFNDGHYNTKLIRSDRNSYLMLDMGSVKKDGRILNKDIKLQALLAKQIADIIIFIVDYNRKLESSDFKISAVLDNIGIPVILAANKYDFTDTEINENNKISDFYELNKGEPIFISALQKRGFDQLHKEILDILKNKCGDQPGIDYKQEISLFERKLRKKIKLEK